MIPRFAAALALLIAGSAQAGRSRSMFATPMAKLVPDAVVMLTMPGVASPIMRGPYAVAQQNIAFVPHLLIVPVGASVEFPNRDRVRHHVYSFSKPKKFELKLYGQEEKRTVVFDQPGVVALGCNIHDRMSGFIFVTPTRFTAAPDATGHVAFDGVPAGKAVLTLWSPMIRRSDNMVAQTVLVSAAGLHTVLAIPR